VRSDFEVLVREISHIIVRCISTGKIYVLRFKDCQRSKDEILVEYLNATANQRTST
jgi:hypothetical protein